MDDAADDPALLAAVQLRLAWKLNLSDGDPVGSCAAAAHAGGWPPPAATPAPRRWP